MPAEDAKKIKMFFLVGIVDVFSDFLQRTYGDLLNRQL